MEIAGANIVVTGGASGIGRGMCERFAALGAGNVVSADVDFEGAGAVAEAIGGTAMECDVTDPASVDRLVQESISAMGHVDLFCANAGVGVGAGLDASDELWDLAWRVNVMGAVYAARSVIPHMTERGGGSFLITASAAGLLTGPVSFNYAVSKHAVIGVAEWLAMNHGPTVRVSALCPTLVDTPMAPEFGTVLEPPLSVEDVVDAAVEGLRDGRFIIAPSERTMEMMRAKAGDWDSFIATMQGRLAAMQNEG